MNKIIQSNLEEHKEVLNQLNSIESSIEAVAKLLICSLKEDKTVFWCGNGGSASDSQHLTGELIGRFNGHRKPLKSISLNADSAVMTCIVNDYGYEHIFSRQIEALGAEGDILIGISTSGNSNNINNAFRMANEKKIHTIGFLGKGGGEALKLVEHSILIPSQSTARIQEMHILIGHTICHLVDQAFKD